jgi:hypothetical protein
MTPLDPQILLSPPDPIQLQDFKQDRELTKKILTVC